IDNEWHHAAVRDRARYGPPAAISRVRNGSSSAPIRRAWDFFNGDFSAQFCWESSEDFKVSRLQVLLFVRLRLDFDYINSPAYVFDNDIGAPSSPYDIGQKRCDETVRAIHV